MKFGEKEDKLFQLLKPDVCEYMEPEKPFTIEETNETGKALITITSPRPCFIVRNLDKKIHTLPFFNEKREQVTKCADHLAFLFNQDNGEWTLHIFELKRSLNEQQWKKICKQFNGAIVRAYAIAGVLRIPEFAGVHLHCGYRKDMSSLSDMKLTREDGPSDAPSPESVLNRKIPLVSYPELSPKNEPIKLDDFTGAARVRLDNNGCTIL